jgi:hypothetical protein
MEATHGEASQNSVVRGRRSSRSADRELAGTLWPRRGQAPVYGEVRESMQR